MLDKAIAPNGIGWNKADTVMYWTESGERKIFKFDFDAKTGDIGESKVFWSTEDNKYGAFATPDGLVIDEEDCIWTALWRGWKVVRINPRGVVIGEIELPTAYVTCPVFVGTQLYIVTARDRNVKEEGIRRGGDVYVVDVSVLGVSKHEFVLKNE
jgi:sugar lactone lactonase YvrE